MNEADFHNFVEKYEDQMLARVLVGWGLIDAELVRTAYQEMQQIQATGEQCKFGQILIKKRLIQIGDYTRAMPVVRQHLQVLYQKSRTGQRSPQERTSESQIPTQQLPQMSPPQEATPQDQIAETQPLPQEEKYKSTQKRGSRRHGRALSSQRAKMQRTQKKTVNEEDEARETGVFSEKEVEISHKETEMPQGDQPSLGKRFGSYEVICEVARGGMGIVYKARQYPLNRIVALKVLLSGGAASEVEIGRFKREAEAAGALQHPNIVSIYEIGEQDGYHYFTMDFIEGVTLQELIKKKTRIKKVVQILEKVALALDHAHKRDIIHRDIKPSNILVSKEGEPKITDFGLAKKLDANTMLTESGAALGTPFYMAPEQTLASKDVDARVDIYALGVILYEALAGRLPFVGDTLVDLYRKIVEEEPIPPSKLNRNVEREIETITLKAMEKDPHLRYQTAQELADDLHRYLSGKTITAKRASVFYRLHRKIKRSRQRIIVVGGIAVVLLSLAFLLYLIITETSEEEKKMEKAKMLQEEGETLAKNGEFDKAMRVWEEAIRVCPQFIKPYYSRGNAYQKRGQYVNAIAEYGRILQKDPENALACFKRGECFSSLEQWDRAIESYTKAIDLYKSSLEKDPRQKIDPSYIEAHDKRAAAYRKRDKGDDVSKAIEDFDKANELREKQQ